MEPGGYPDEEGGPDDLAWRVRASLIAGVVILGAFTVFIAAHMWL